MIIKTKFRDLAVSSFSRLSKFTLKCLNFQRFDTLTSQRVKLFFFNLPVDQSLNSLLGYIGMFWLNKTNISILFSRMKSNIKGKKTVFFYLEAKLFGFVWQSNFHLCCGSFMKVHCSVKVVSKKTCRGTHNKRKEMNEKIKELSLISRVDKKCLSYQFILWKLYLSYNFIDQKKYYEHSVISTFSIPWIIMIGIFSVLWNCMKSIFFINENTKK